jgi:putative Ca2+/H+ antiporter (TMEM165/GDT1 family)
VVLAGVLVATLLNHLLAVALGDYLTNFIPLNTIQLIAAISFILFGLWTLRGDTLEGEDKKVYFNPFWTVTIAFFMAEMGDKTQLAAVALGAKYSSLFMVWMGTTIGMMISNIIGIIVGVVLGKKIPEKVVKIFAACIFIIFGYIGILSTLTDSKLRILTLVLATAIVTAYISFLYFQKQKTVERSSSK